MPFIKLDLRELYFAHGSVSRFHLYRILSQELSRLSRSHKIRSWLEKIGGIKIGDFEVQLDWREKGASITDVLKSLDEWASAQKGKLIIAIDEAQYLRLAGRVRYDGLIAWATDNLDHLVFVLAGSEVGLLQDFLGLEDPSSPLYGRYAKIIKLQRLDRDRSLDFLERGFKEAGVEPPDLEEVVEVLNGLIGWLTLYGHTYVSEGKVELEDFLKRAANLAEEESKRILRGSERYWVVLKAVASGATTWSQVYEWASLRLGPISKSNLTYLLKSLSRYGYLEEKEEGFNIPDPVVRYLASHKK